MANDQQGLNPDVTRLVSRELLRLQYEQLPRALLFNILISTIFVLASWNDLPRTYLVAWYVTLMLVTILRYSMVQYFLKRGLEHVSIELLTGTTAMSALIVGSIWAALATVVIFTDQAVFHVLVTLLICGLAAGAMSSNAYLLSSYIGFMAPMLIALAAVFFWQQTSVSIAVAVLLLFYMGYLMVSARMFHRNISESIELAIENKQLSEALNESKINLERTIAELERLSSADALTGIANRRRYETYIRDSWTSARRNKKPISMVLLDIDHFKEYNDEYGHQMGDQCLVQVAQAIESCSLRDSDLVARIGGEEFAIIMPATNGIGALHMAETVHQAISQLNISHRASPVTSHVTVSLGVATADEVGESDFAVLVGAADHSLYEAKESGRDLVVVSGREIH